MIILTYYNYYSQYYCDPTLLTLWRIAGGVIGALIPSQVSRTLFNNNFFLFKVMNNCSFWLPFVFSTFYTIHRSTLESVNTRSTSHIQITPCDDVRDIFSREGCIRLFVFYEQILFLLNFL